MKNLTQKGQLLVEILLAIAISALLVGAAASLILIGLKSSQTSGDKETALAFAREGLEAIESIRENLWHDIYLPPDGTGNSDNKGDSFPYYIYNDGSSWKLSNDIANRDTIINGRTYSRTVYLYNVKRNETGDRQIDEISGINDPSTQKIKIFIQYNNGQEIYLSEYITRWKNEIFIQTDWTGGSGESGPLLYSNPATKYFSDDGNIDTSGGSLKLK